jgi:hypothetical protein
MPGGLGSAAPPSSKTSSPIGVWKEFHRQRVRAGEAGESGLEDGHPPGHSPPPRRRRRRDRPLRLQRLAHDVPATSSPRSSASKATLARPVSTTPTTLARNSPPPTNHRHLPVHVDNIRGSNVFYQPKYAEHVVKLFVAITMTGFIVHGTDLLYTGPSNDTVIANNQKMEDVIAIEVLDEAVPATELGTSKEMLNASAVERELGVAFKTLLRGFVVGRPDLRAGEGQDEASEVKPPSARTWQSCLLATSRFSLEVSASSWLCTTSTYFTRKG